MKLVVVGVNHRDTPLEIREKGAFTTSQINQSIAKLVAHPEICEAVVLSTCNRSEIYVTTPEATLQRVEAIVKNFYCLEKSEQLQPYLFSESDRSAIQHLYRVVTGLNSMILGEDQILGQAKEALDKAHRAQGAGKYLTKAFREAITFTKKVKTIYKISEKPLSLSSTAVKYIKRHVEDYANKNILIIGSGKMGILALRYMASEGFNRVFMTNRTYHSGDEYRHIYKGINVYRYEDRYHLISDMDVVISATASPHLVIKKEGMRPRKKPLLMIDLALPRDVDRNVTDLEGITLLTIDDFKHFIDEKTQERLDIAQKIEKEIECEIDNLVEWIDKSKVDDMIGRFNRMAMTKADETIDLLNERYAFEGKDKDYLEKIVKSKFRQMVMPAIHGLKSLDGKATIDHVEQALNCIFDGGEG